MAAQHGSKAYAVLLCYSSDQPDTASRRPPSYFTDLFVNSPKGMNAYWREVSYGNINLDGTQVFGWRKLSRNTAQLQALTRGQKASAAANEFANDPDAAKRVDFSQFYGVIAIFDPDIDFGATSATIALANGQTFGKPALVAAQNHDTGGHAHEMGHTLGLDHSFDDALVPVDPADDGRPGAYGDLWDAMSYGNNIRFDNSPFGSGGPGLNAVQLGLMDWIAPARLLNAGTGLVEIAALNTPGSSPIGLVVGNSTFEFRMNDGWDRGFSRPTVFRHTLEFNSAEHSMLHKLTPYTFEFQPGDVWEDGYAWDPYHTYHKVQVAGFDTQRRTASFNVVVRVGEQPPVVGPGSLFGGVDVGGGGFIFINGQFIRVPPRSPLYSALEHIAELQASELIQDARLRDAVKISSLKALNGSLAGLRSFSR